jgi:hypothetical protein
MPDSARESLIEEFIEKFATVINLALRVH